MDDCKPPSQDPGMPLQGPHWHPTRDLDTSSGVVPMRLVLQPSGRAVELTQPDTLLGRHSTSDICLRLPDVSRRHCRFVFTDNQWHVFDLQSLNGIFVNGTRVEQAALHQRDVIRIGSLTFEVDLLPGPATVQLPSHGPRTAGERILESISDALPKEATGTQPERLAS